MKIYSKAGVWGPLALMFGLAQAGCGENAPSPSPDIQEDTSVPDDTSDGDSSGDATDDSSDDSSDADDTSDDTDASEDSSDTTDGDTEVEDERTDIQPEDRHEPGEVRSGALLAGVAEMPLNPPVGISMGGFGGRAGSGTSPWAGDFFASSGSHGHLMLKVMAFEVEGERFVLVKLPMVFSEDTLTKEIALALEQRHSLDLHGRIVTAATHTHHGPGRFWRLPNALGVAGIDTPDDEIIQLLATRISDAVAAAVADIGPAEWAYGMLEDWDPQNRVYRDRRSVNDPHWGKDPRLTVMALRRPDGDMMGVMTNFAMHGTVLQAENRLLSDDAAGGFEQKLDEAIVARYGKPAMSMFTQSGGGDAAPAGGHLSHSGEQRMQMLGEFGAQPVLDLVDTLEWRSEAELTVRSRMIDIRHDWIYGDSGEFSNYQGKPFEFGTLLCNIDPETNLSGPGQPKDCQGIDYVFEIFGVEDGLPHPELEQAYLTVGRLGGLFFMTIPGEPTYSLVKYAREQFSELAPEQDLLVFGYAQDHFLYLTHPDDWYYGGYEAQFEIWGPWSGRWFVDRQLDTLSAMLQGMTGPLYYEEFRDRSPELNPTVRPLEKSVQPGSSEAGVPASVRHSDVFEVVVSGGDPRFGLPTFTLERQVGEEWVSVLDPIQQPFGNGRYESITLYEPIPANSREILPERTHNWRWRWQVNPNLLTGAYRVRAEGQAYNGSETAPWAWTSESFEIQNASPELHLEEMNTSELKLTVLYPPEPIQKSGGIPTRGWQVFDPGVTAESHVRLRESLRVSVNAGSLQRSYDLEFDEALGGYVLPLAGMSMSSITRIEVGLIGDTSWPRASYTAD